MLAPKAEVSMFPWKKPKADSPGGAPDTFLSPGASACFCLDGGVYDKA